MHAGTPECMQDPRMTAGTPECMQGPPNAWINIESTNMYLGRYIKTNCKSQIP